MKRLNVVCCLSRLLTPTSTSLCCRCSALYLYVCVVSQVEPALWLWAPDDGRDRPWRKFQHLYWPLPFSLTFLLWRIGSIKTAISEKLKLEVRTDGLTDRQEILLNHRKSPNREENNLGGKHAGIRPGTPRFLGRLVALYVSSSGSALVIQPIFFLFLEVEALLADVFFVFFS